MSIHVVKGKFGTSHGRRGPNMLFWILLVILLWVLFAVSQFP